MFPSTPNRLPWLRQSLLLVTALGAFLAASEARAEPLDRELRRSAEEIHKYLRENSYHNVGVLKFRVKRGNEPTRDNVGILNQSLADRLETALVLTSPDESVGIIRNASSGAATLGSGATHLTPEGRKALLGRDYPVVWGDSKVKPDILLTGLAKISLNPRETVVSILAFHTQDRGARLLALRQFTVPTELSSVIESGGSYIATRGFFRPGMAVAQAAQHPLSDANCPVILDIFYGDRKISCVFEDDRAFVESPAPGDRVSFVLRLRNPKDEATYGVVLKVNGENTFYHEKLPDALCWKWILHKGWPETRITGYQVTKGENDPFQILPDDHSGTAAIQYGKDAGQITLVVFRARDGVPPVTQVAAADNLVVPRVEVGVKETAEDVLAAELPPALPDNVPGVPVRGALRILAQQQEEVIRLGGLLASKGASLKATQVTLMKSAELKTRSATTRGLIVPSGKKGASAIEEVTFTAADEPDVVATITYFKPK